MTKINVFESETWRIISLCEWQKNHDYERIREYLSDTNDETILSRVEKQIDIFYEALDVKIEALTELEKEELPFSGDDGYSDMIMHVIGLGEAFYNSAMSDPMKIKETEPKESFSYCFHFDDMDL